MHSVEHPIIRAPVRPRRKGETVADNVVPLSAAMVQLQHLKERVPFMRDALGPKVWERLTAGSPVTLCPTRRPISRAYAKLKEILLTCAIAPPEVSVHLCEAPGGFVQAAWDIAPEAWTWTALSLHTPGAPIPARDLLPMHCGSFHGADVFDVESCCRVVPGGAADLVTADGAIEMQHANLEEEHLDLLIAQSRVALHALKRGGTFVIKFFEGGRQPTLAWIAWLTNLFGEVSIVKPTSSRPSNSERYLVGRGFLSAVSTLPGIDELFVSPLWLRDLQRLMDTFAVTQKNALQRALDRGAAILGTRAPLSVEMGSSQEALSGDGRSCVCDDVSPG